MLNYARQRLRDVLKDTRSVVMASTGPAGVQAGEYACQAVDLSIYLLLPGTSDHLFNLEHDPHVVLLATNWELRGEAQVLHAPEAGVALALLHRPEAAWCVLARVQPHHVQIRTGRGWGQVETFDLAAGESGCSGGLREIDQ